MMRSGINFLIPYGYFYSLKTKALTSMKKRSPILILMFFVLGQITVAAQTNSVFSSVAAEQVIKGIKAPKLDAHTKLQKRTEVQ